MAKRSLVLAALLLSFPIRAVSVETTSSRAESDYAEAWAELGNWRRAVTHYRKAVKLDPHNLSARLGLVRGLQKLGRDKQARAQLGRLAGKDSLPVPLLAALGVIQLEMNRPEEACRIFARVLGKQPDHQRAGYGRGQCLQASYRSTGRDSDKRRAIRAYRRYLERFPEGRYAISARNALQLLVYRENGRTLARARKAFSEGDYARAEKLLTRLIARRPDLPRAHYLLGLVYAHPQVGKTALADQALEKAGDLKEALLQRAVLAFERDNLALAERLLNRALRGDLGYARPHYYLGLVYRDRLENRKARKAFARVVELAPDGELAERAGSKLQILSGNLQRLPEGEVIDTASQIQLGRKLSQRIEKQFGLVEDQKLKLKLNRILRRLVSRVDGLPLAVPYRIKVLELDGINALSFIDGTIYLFQGLCDFIRQEMNDSDDVYAAVIGHEVVHVVMRHGLDMLDLKAGGRALTGGSSFDVRGLRRLMQGLGRVQEYQADQLGSLYAYRAGFDPAAGLRFHHKLIQRGREVPEDLEHPTHGQRADRLREYLLGLRSKVRHFDAGLESLEAGDYPASITHFEIFLGFFPASLSARNNLGVAMHRQAQGRHDSPREYKLSTDIDPDRRVDPVRLREKGETFDRALMIEAAEIFRTTARLAPDYLPARTNLGACLLALGEKEPARRMFEAVAAKSKDSLQARSNLAVLDLLAGRPDPGIAALKQIIKEKPDFADAHFNLGLARLERGQPDKARRCFRSYLALDPGSGWARLARNHLKKLTDSPTGSKRAPVTKQ